MGDRGPGRRGGRPDDGGGGDRLGCSVSVSGNAAVVGALNDDDGGDNSGSAYLFTREGSTWSESAKLLCSSGAEDDNFGDAVSIGGGTIAVGAPWDDDAGNNCGAAYAFDAGGGSCSGDVTGDGNVDFDDILAILAAWGSCEDCPEDIDGDGDVAFADLLVVLSAWGPCVQAGMPSS